MMRETLDIDSDFVSIGKTVNGNWLIEWRSNGVTGEDAATIFTPICWLLIESVDNFKFYTKTVGGN